MPDALTGASGCWGGRKVPGSAGQLTPVHPEPGTVTSAADGFLAEPQPNDRRARLRSPSSNTSPLDRSSTRAPAVAPRAWARAAEVGPRQVAPRGASSRTTASWRTSGRRCTARCSEPTAAGVRVIGGVTTSAQPRLDGDGGPKSMKAESRRSNPALDVVRVSDMVSPEPLVTQDFGPGNGSRRPQDADARCRSPGQITVRMECQ
jgi:hypothetical protein